MQKREIWMYTKWNEKEQLTCGCLYKNPLCPNYPNCEFLKAIYSPFQDVETVMKAARQYKRINGRMRETK